MPIGGMMGRGFGSMGAAGGSGQSLDYMKLLAGLQQVGAQAQPARSMMMQPPPGMQGGPQQGLVNPQAFAPIATAQPQPAPQQAPQQQAQPGPQAPQGLGMMMQNPAKRPGTFGGLDARGWAGLGSAISGSDPRNPGQQVSNAAQAYFGGRDAMAADDRQRAMMQQLNDAMNQMNVSPQMRALAMANPEKALELMAAAKPPGMMNVGAGGVVFDPTTGKPIYENKAQKEEKPQNLPPGMMFDEQGKPQWIPGYKEGYREMHPQSAGGASKGRYRTLGSDEVKALGLPDGTIVEEGPDGNKQILSAAKNQSEYTPAQAAKYKAQAGGLDSIKFALGEYRDAVNRHGTKLIANPNDSDVAELEAAHNSLMMLLKSPDMFALGVLTGPDLELLEKSVTPPTGMKSFGANADTIGTRLNVLDRFLAQKYGQIPPEFVPPSKQSGGNGNLLPSSAGGFMNTVRGLANAPKGPQQADPMEAHIDSLFGNLEDEVPDGMDPENWKYLTPEEQQDYLAGNN